MNRQQFEKYLNGIEVPEEERKSNGGRVPDSAKFGSWLRRNDPIAFEVALNEHQYARGER